MTKEKPRTTLHWRNRFKSSIMQKLIILFLFISSTHSCFAQSQPEMNQQENKNYVKANNELNSTYQKILKEYKSDTIFIKNLKASQNLWVKFRDAEMKTKYPDREPGFYGSVQPMCWSIYLTQLTQERIKTLRPWLDGIEEGDVCSGSTKIR